MSKRRLARENCLQSLYLADISTLETPDILAIFQLQEFALEESVFGFYKNLFTAAVSNREKIDGIITATSRNWDLERMSATDRCVLRLAVCEMMFLEDAPVPVIIDEAIELAKKYSTENSGKFVNGVLDSVAKQHNLKNST
ncbi:MAG: transcription antitermination factor NusB [Elusimicrobia bacterium GWA2_56_46]|jgi:N utilization substance protein B|nr:MAG: transcription antitermination factor NusB [Elusimicrobia bacterium GWA2_56_46]OGR54833.1 MAG: transcription antitermination factor NusB [Elusimicrobia bacterium GWC2_56_31]HBB67099.1 transcription antitermination factor NusB [Elusimicrobiota bacterium]HBW23375.1 transcription antitermination factor NusB [Elusimicrobiota bacterium]